LKENTASDLLRERIIFFGADVTHPAPGDKMSPSVAAVVASIDPSHTTYSASISVQQHRIEIIQNMENLALKHIQKYYRSNQYLPRRIIFYRDGTGEGQFREVMSREVMAIREACKKIPDGPVQKYCKEWNKTKYEPGITFIMVRKRHHTRFDCKDYKDRCGKSGNVPAGTVVDTTVVHPFEFDFFLCSHQGLQGTSRPAHYHVIHDDNDFSSDTIQQLSNELCYIYARSTTSVGMVAPAYYAHLVAFRARYYLSQYGFDSTMSSTSSLSEKDIEEMQGKVNIHAEMQMCFI